MAEKQQRGFVYRDGEVPPLTDEARQELADLGHVCQHDPQIEEQNALLLRAEQQGYRRALREHGLGGWDDPQPEEKP